MTLTKNDLFNLTSPKGMFTPDSIRKDISWNGKEKTVYIKTIDGCKIEAGSLDRLEEMVKSHKPYNNDCARFDYNNGTNFNND